MWLPRGAGRFPLLFWLLLAAVASAPFEPMNPLLSLPGQKLTWVELVVFFSLGVWLLTLLAARRLPDWRTPLAWPTAALIVWMLISTLFSASDMSIALRTTARVVIGVLIYHLVVDVVRSRARLATVLGVASVTGAVVGIIGILEYSQVLPVLEWLKHFRPDKTVVAGHLRVSSTLQYPTIASMFLEIAFGLGLGVLLLTARSHPRRTWIPSFGALAIGTAVLLTLTRSGMITLAVMLGAALTLWVRRYGFGTGTRAMSLIACILLAEICWLVIADPNLSLRLSAQDHRSWYRAGFASSPDLRMRPGELRTVRVQVVNRGRANWYVDEEAPFCLSYHWLTADGSEIVDYEGLRTCLAEAVGPGRSVTLTARVRAPRSASRYLLAWDMVQENRFWFSDENAADAFTEVLVEQDESAVVEEPFENLGGKHAPASSLAPPEFIGRRELWPAAARMMVENPFLGVGPGNFRLLYGPYAGLEDWDRRYHSNNLYIEFFVCTGVVGGFLFLWTVGRLLGVLVQLWRQSSTVLPLSVGISVAVLAILIHGLFDYFLEFTPTYIITWLTFGLAVAASRLENPKGGKRTREGPG